MNSVTANRYRSPASGLPQVVGLLHFAFLLLFSIMASAQDLPGQGDYVLAAGDTVEVRVYGEDDLSMQLDVPAGGPVDYAFVGPVELPGKTVRAVQQELYERLLGDYLVDPKVSVSVVRYRNFYVYGEVARPGGYAWEPGLTVRKVITLAGGLRERASGSKWFLVPEGGGEAERRRVSEDDAVGPGDTLTIEQSFF
jgi:polysaccharide export outer membrane protein